MRLPRFRIRTLMIAVAVVGMSLGTALRWPAFGIVAILLAEAAGAPIAIVFLSRRIANIRIVFFCLSVGIFVLLAAQLWLASLARIW
jgi:hypothetical protein